MNKKFHESYQIAELVTKIILGEASEEEKHQLQQWLEESPTHQKEYGLWMERLEKDLNKIESNNAQSAWKKFRNKVRPQRPVYLRTGFLCAYAAAAAILILAFLFGGFNHYQQEVQEQLAIVPGSSKAMLLTDNGEEFDINAQGGVQFFPNFLEDEVKNEEGVLYYNQMKVPADSLKDVYHTLNVPRGGEYQLVLADGTHIYLNSESQIKYPVVFSEKDSLRRVYIKGEAYFDVAHNASKPFVVHTQHGVIQVLGTQFNVQNYTDEDMAVVTLLEGRIAYLMGGKAYKLAPKEQLRYSKTDGNITQEVVDASVYASWIDGIFEFNGMPLEQIMKQLARWYDVSYQFNNAQLKKHQFTGITYRHTSLESLLQQIEKTTQIHFKIENRTIYIYN